MSVAWVWPGSWPCRRCRCSPPAPATAERTIKRIVPYERDVGGRPLIDQVEDDRAEEQADRDVRQSPRGADGPASGRSAVLDRADRSEQRRQPAMVEVTEGARPPVVDRHEPREKMGHGSGTSLTSIHNPSTTSTTSGIRSRAPPASSWISPLWFLGPGPYIGLARRGRSEPPDRSRGAIQQRPREPGSRAARLASEGPGGDQGLQACSKPQDPLNGSVSHQFLGRFCASRKPSPAHRLASADARPRCPDGALRPTPTPGPGLARPRRGLLGHLDGRGPRRQPGLRAPAGVPAPDGRPRGRPLAFIGLFSALVFVVGMPLVPLWGVWADKYRRKAVIVRSALVEAVVFAGVALSQGPWQLASRCCSSGSSWATPA